MKYLIIGIIIVGSIFVFIAATIPHQHNDDCKWIAPLKTNYVMCNDGKVREK